MRALQGTDGEKRLKWSRNTLDGSFLRGVRVVLAAPVLIHAHDNIIRSPETPENGFKAYRTRSVQHGAHRESLYACNTGTVTRRPVTISDNRDRNTSEHKRTRKAKL